MQPPSYQKPNFFLIGASKCGTSALARYLAAHPDICFSNPKEPNFFNNDLHPGTYASFDEYYERVFQNPEQYAFVGEGSVRYIYSQTAVPNILAHNPEAKLIVMLRNPVTMCESWYYEQRAAGRENAPTLKAAWRRDHAPREGDEAGVHLRHYQTFCRLGEQLARVYTQAAREQVLVLFYDDLAQDPGAVYRQVLAFLGVSDDGRDSFPVINRSRATFHPAVSGLLRMYGRAKRRFGIQRGVGHHPFVQRVLFGKKPPMPVALRREMTEHFKDDVTLLEELTGRDLRHWKEVQHI